MALKITLDPGHGQYGNKSPNNTKYIEGTQMWHLANKLKVALEAYGFEVVTTRPKISDASEILGLVVTTSKPYASSATFSLFAKCHICVPSIYFVLLGDLLPYCPCPGSSVIFKAITYSLLTVVHGLFC